MTLLKIITVLMLVMFLFPWVRRRAVRLIGPFGVALLCGLLAFMVLVGLRHY